ncbi:MFS transporter [Cytobacillus sp. NCCP-133]|uniref:MFS transporter n=1 Tax=Cytobacillus sp. NCCP-133 TaxID=766848 RepID=UPI00222EFF9B|nr:MFS transporter [Cytobacillus sp. NCCP-133]GLB59006.1 MFS transporter [Cytobacillus sp. NCCP-133]
MTAVKEFQQEPTKYSLRDAGFLKIMTALTSASILVFANLYFVQPIMPLLVQSYEITSAAAGLSLSAAVISMVIGLLFFGFLSDRIGRVPIMTSTLICTVIPLALMPIAANFELFLVLRFVQGFFIAGLPAAAIAYLGEELDSRSISLGISMYIAANAIGGMAGRVFAGYLADIASWQKSIYFLFGISILLFAVYFITVPKSRFFKSSKKPIKKDLFGMGSHLKNTKLFPAFAMGILLQFSFTGAWTYLPFYLEQPPFNLSVKNISFTYLAYGFGIVGSLLGGRLSAQFKKTTLVSVGTLILIGGTLLTNVHSLSAVVVGLCLTCLGFFVAHSLMAAIVNERATHHKGGASSIYLVSYYLGVATGGTLAGLVWQTAGWIGVTVVSLALVPVVLWLIGSYSRYIVS